MKTQRPKGPKMRLIPETPPDMSPAEIMRLEAKLIKKAGPVLHGLDPRIQGALLACLIAKWAAGHPDWLRESLLGHLFGAIKALTPVEEAIMTDGMGHPQNTGGQPPKDTDVN